MKRFVSSVIFLILFGSFAVLAQNDKFAVCQQRQAWLVNDQKVIKLGDCGNVNWTLRIIIDELNEEQFKKSIPLRKKLFPLLKTINLTETKVSELSITNLNKIISSKKKFETLYLKSEELPENIKGLLLDSVAKNSMRFIVTSGTGYLPNRYEEMERFVVIVEEEDPTIHKILEEFKKVEIRRLKGTKGEWILDYASSYYLTTEDINFNLDPTKRASDYKLKNYAILRVFTGSR